MVKFVHPLNSDVFNLYQEAPSDYDAAAKLLLHAVTPLRRGEALPYGVAHVLADAIEASMEKTQKLRAKAFTDELYLTSQNRRPAASWLLVGADFEEEFYKTNRQSKTAISISIKYNISESTAINYRKQYKKAKEIHDLSCLE